MGGKGSGGHNRKPAALKQLQGNAGKRKLKDEIPTVSGVPRLPKGLGAAASREWRRIVPLLRQVGILTRLDGKALAAYCSAYGQWMDAEKLIQKYGVVVAETRGDGSKVLRTNPAIRIKSDALKLMKSYLCEFGLTPASRAKLELNDPPEKEDPFEAFLTRNASKAGGAEGKRPN